MAKLEHPVKCVIVHVGPHKTGSTALQECLTINKAELSNANILFFHNDITHEAAMMLAQEQFDEAEKLLKSLAQKISEATEEIVILSQEDFCGDIPGRSRRKTIYPKLAKNFRVIARAFQPHPTTFLFFEREEKDWLESCYRQHIKHRTTFSNFDTFRDFFVECTPWKERLKKPKEILGSNLVTAPYRKNSDAGLKVLLEIANRPNLRLSQLPLQRNSSPSNNEIKLLERTNALSSFKPTAWFAKNLILNGWSPRIPSEQLPNAHVRSQSLAAISFPELVLRASARIAMQEIDDILPSADVDLNSYLFELLPENAEPPAESRVDIYDQSKILDYHLRGKSKLAKLNALTISYLRRNTEHTRKAQALFHRVWSEFGPFLINELSTRWLISTLQTFLDHGRNESQRMIGSCGYFYANMLKIYEGERSIEGLAQDEIYENAVPQTISKFPGLDRYQVGGTDLLLNTNAMALDLAMRDDVAGLVLQELLLRVKSSGNVFTRMDRTRRDKGIEISGFADTWSFYVEPK